MSASDAAPLPRLGEVFFDVRGDSRTMRLSWYADTGVAVFSIWQGGTCTGTFRLPIGDLPRMVTALQRGPGGQDEHAGHEDPAARAGLPGEDGGEGASPPRGLRPARPAGPDITTGQWDVPGGTPPGPRGADSGRGERPGGYLPGPGTGDHATGTYDYPPPRGYPAAAQGDAAAPDETSYLPGPGSGAFPGDPAERPRGDDPRSGYPRGRGSGGFPAGPPEPGRRGRGAGGGYPPEPGFAPGGPGPAGYAAPEPGSEFGPGGPGSGAFAAPEIGGAGFPAAEPGSGGFGVPESGRRDGVPDPGYLPGRGSEDPGPEPGRRSRRARGYVPEPGSGGFGGGLPEPGPRLPGPRLPEPRRPEPGGYHPEPEGGRGAGRSPRGRRAAAPERGGFPPEPGSGDFPADPDQAGYAARGRGGRRAGPGGEPAGMIGAYQPVAPGGYRGEPDYAGPDYAGPDSAREPHYSGDLPDADYRRVSPAEPYTDLDPAGEDGDSGEEWEDPALPPAGGYREGPPPESFPYGPPAGNERRHRG